MVDTVDHPLSRTVIRGLFALPPLLVIAQLALIHGRFGEPYPAIMMPAFGGTLSTPAGDIAVESAVVLIRFADGTTARDSLRTLLAEMPVSHHWVVGTTMFRPTPNEAAPAPRSGLKAWIIEHVTPVRDRWAERRRRGNPIESDTRSWLADRVAVMYPGRPVSGVDFEWLRLEYRFEDGRPVLVHETVTERYPVDLHP